MKLKRFATQLVAAGLMAIPLTAGAAGLGKLSVTSALGQPLAAEIELFAADKAELDSLSASLASDQAFRDARVDFAPVLSTLRFAVVKKPDGKAVLKVTSTRPVNDPFVDMLIELNWASGRLVREYTVLLDPPGTTIAQTPAPVVVEPALTAAPPPAVTEPQPAEATEPGTATLAEPSPASATGAPTTSAAEATAEPVPEPRPAAPATDTRPSAAEAAPSFEGDRILVKRGDTLTRIAQRVRPDSVTLEQTLIGLFRENPHAFEGNVNRLKAGKTLEIPSAEKVAAIRQQEAARELRLQAADWRAYRQKLAAAVSAAPEAERAADQTSSGKITPKVEDRAAPAAEAQQDVLKLSKAAPATAGTDAKAAEQARAEDATAREKALQESGERVAMLEKQVQDMRKLAELQENAPAEGAASTDEAAPPETPVAEAETEAPAPEVEAAPAPVPAPLAVEAPPAAPAPADKWYAPLLANPMYWGGALAALGLGGLLWWRMASGRRRKTVTTTMNDSLIVTGGVHPPIVPVAASGGSVNTGDSSFLTDFSQAGLGTIDTHDVDPIAEAEVYMAYGRGAQAEEILREAIAKNPERHEIRLKLLEIFAARRNPAEFEAAAGELYAALGSKTSPLWTKACEMGRSIDPSNPLYGGDTLAESSGNGASATVAATVAATAAVAGGAVSFIEDRAPASPPAETPPPRVETPPPPRVETPPPRAEVPPPAPVFEPEPLADISPLDFESAGEVLDFTTSPAPSAAAKADATRPEVPDTQGLAFDFPDLDLPVENAPPVQSSDAGSDDSYDFSGLDLDLEPSAEEELDEVGTKLDLARAYVEMGDKDGAREILDEVLAEGSESQKSDAKALMSTLG